MSAYDGEPACQGRTGKELTESPLNWPLLEVEKCSDLVWFAQKKSMIEKVLQAWQEVKSPVLSGKRGENPL